MIKKNFHEPEATKDWKSKSVMELYHIDGRIYAQIMGRNIDWCQQLCVKLSGIHNCLIPTVKAFENQ